MEVTAALARVLARADLAADEIAAVFGRIMDGECTPAQIGGLLVALRMKGETADEIAGGAGDAARATPIALPGARARRRHLRHRRRRLGSINVSTSPPS